MKELVLPSPAAPAAPAQRKRMLPLFSRPTIAPRWAALALAICHCWRAPMIARMAKAEAMAAEQKRAYQARLKAAPARAARSAP